MKKPKNDLRNPRHPGNKVILKLAEALARIAATRDFEKEVAEKGPTMTRDEG